MKIIIITGQTATGKTRLALECAHKYNGELINCDSRQIYKLLDIITGKDIDKTFNFVTRIKDFEIGYYLYSSRNSKIKLWLYDIVNPKDYFSSFDYQKCTLPVIKKILSEGKTPIIVGGTYFYLYHLLYNIQTDNIKPDWKLRKKLENKSVSELQRILKKINTQFFNLLNKSEANNPQRLTRKIELSLNAPIARLIEAFTNNAEKPNLEKKLKVKNLKIEFNGLKFKDKEKLKIAIKNRVEKRVNEGAIDEVKKLLKMGYKETDPGLKTIGYQQIILHLKGKLTKEKAINQWVTKEIQYAKRQLTFMKKDKNIRWREI